MGFLLERGWGRTPRSWWCQQSCCKCKRGRIYWEFRRISQNVKTDGWIFLASQNSSKTTTCWFIDQTWGSKSMIPAMKSLSATIPKRWKRFTYCNPRFSWSSSTLKCCSSNKPSKRPQVSTKRISTGLKRIGLEQKKTVPVFQMWLKQTFSFLLQKLGQVSLDGQNMYTDL